MGKHTHSGGGRLYIKRLSNVQMPTLTKLVQKAAKISKDARSD